MTKTRSIKNKVIAWMLVSVYAVFWLSFNLHHFFAPEHHHEKKVCHHAPNEKHLHGEEYAAENCSICQIVPNLAELPAFFVPIIAAVEFGSQQINFGKTIYFSAAPYSLFQPRAPPVRKV